MDSKTVHTIIRQTKENYNIIAREWDTSRDRPSGIKTKLVAHVKPGMHVLDVGSGNGLIVPHVLAKKARYTGIDVSRALIVIAKKQYARALKTKHVVLAVADITKQLPYITGSFDIIFCFAVLHHIPSAPVRKKVLREWCRVLKPGAKAYTIVWNLKNEWPNKRFNVDAQLAKPLDGMDAGDVFIPWKATHGTAVSRYVHVFEKSELKKLFLEAGFSSVTLRYYNRAGAPEANGEELVIVAKK